MQFYTSTPEVPSTDCLILVKEGTLLFQVFHMMVVRTQQNIC